MRSRRTYAALAAVVILLLACNLPLAVASRARNLASTILDRAGASQASSATPASLPVTGGTVTPAGVQVSVTVPTNCRSGPSAEYEQIFIASPGVSYQVVGKYTVGNYWIIVGPGGGTCWLWGQFAVITGNVGSLREYTPPGQLSETATPMPAIASAAATGAAVPVPTLTDTPEPTHLPPPPPGPPTALRGTRTCTAGSDGTTAIWIEVVTLTWHDTSGETGYRVYEGGVPISTIPQNSISYQMKLRYNQGASGSPSDTFGLEAYNTGGTSSRLSVDVPRCP